MTDVRPRRAGDDGASAHVRPSESARGPVAVGLVVIAIFFGGLGAWAFSAPLNGAVIGDAVVKVEGNRKSVQKRQGGTVGEIRVEEGDAVAAGEVLLVLDDAELRSERDLLVQQGAMLAAMEARLGAEQMGLDTLGFPSDLLADRDASHVAAAIAGQTQEFAARDAALEGERSLLERRIAQLREEIDGAEAQAASYQAQMRSVLDEKSALEDLADRQLVPRTRLLQLERSAMQLQGQVGEAMARSAKAEETIRELNGQIAQLHKDRAEQIARDLRDTRLKLIELRSRLHANQRALAELEVRAPYAGRVVGLTVFSVGAVIAPGETVLDIVPDSTPLTIEAEIGVNDISEVRPGMPAEVHFGAARQRNIPRVQGTIGSVSADRLTHERTGVAYYAVVVEIDRQALAASPEVDLYPGMPATVIIPTKERKAIDYIVGPLASSFDRAFRQR